MTKLVTTTIMAVALILPSAAPAQAPSQDLLHEIATDVYVFGYPMVLMETTRRLFTNVPAPEGSYAPMNQFAHNRAFPDHTFRQVVRPNADTFYSMLWFDVTDGPLIVSMPDAGGRYYMLPILDFWTDVFAAPGSRTSGTESADFAIAGPAWEGDLPEGVEPIRSPTGMGWIIGRTRVDGPADAANVHPFQDDMRATPLSRWGDDYAPPGTVPIEEGLTPTAEPPLVVAGMDAETFFELFAHLLKQNPPHEMDWNMVTQMEQLGIVPGENFDFSELPLQHESPGADVESNWLPAPSDGFNLIMRLYWPEPTLLTGDWDPPPVRSSKYVGRRLTPK